MKVLFMVLLVLHALIHLLGFLKGFGLKEINELTLPISRPLGLFWLIATVSMLAYAILYYTNYRYAWLIGFTAVLFSQVLIIYFWKDAKFGTIPNLLILVVSIGAFGCYQFNKKVQKETELILSQNQRFPTRNLTASDLTHLPDPVKKWLFHSGAVGKPFTQIGQVVQQASMKMKPEENKWMSASAIQYTTINEPAFIWTVDAEMNSLLNFQGRDKFENGKGEMLIKLNSFIPVVQEKGAKLDEATLQRYLGEMVWFPSLAVSPYISWVQLNDSTAKATMQYKGTEASGTFYFNSAGDFIQFSAWRYMGNDANSKRHEWVLLVENYRIFEGIKIPSKMTATWRLKEGDWTWLKLEIVEAKYNEQVMPDF